MSRQELIDEMEEIQLRWYNTFKGTNEADLMIREEIADLLLPLIASKEEEIKELKDILQGITDSFNPQMRNALTNRQTDAIEDARQYFLTNQ